MRILLINDSARIHTGGIHRMVVESCDLLMRAGHDVALAFSDGGPADVQCETFGFPPNEDSVALRDSFADILGRFRPDVVQFHATGKVWFDTIVAGRAPTCRFIHDQTPICSGGDRMARDFSPCHRPHAISCLFWHYLQGCGGRNPLNNLRRWQMVHTMQEVKDCRSIRIQVASEFMRCGLLENSWDESRIDVVPLFSLPPRSTLPTEPGMLLVACRLVESKGVQVLLEAMLDVNHPAWRLVIAGTGPTRGRLQAYVDANGLASRVTFVGEISPAELDSYYARAQIVITPTLRPEPFGLIGPESMTHGKPIVAFSGGATEEWLTDNETGIVVRERSPSSLASAIESLLRNPAQCEKLGAQARQRSAIYRTDAFLSRLIRSFENCISHAAAHP